MRALRCRRLWTPGGLVEDALVEVDATGRIADLRPGRAGDGPLLDGIVVPGLVNAHTHLELSQRAGRVPGGEGFRAWVGRSVRTPDDPGLPDGATQARRLRDTLGVAVVVDLSNGGHTAPWLVEAGLAGVVQHEILGRGQAQQAAARAVIARGLRPVSRDVVVRPSPHALLSTRPSLVQAAVRAGGDVPASLHVGETADEERLLRSGDGPIADWLDALGRAWRDEAPPGVDAIALLDRLGVLGPSLLLVHGIHLAPDALRRAARARATLVSCPRSNLHIEGRLPDLRLFLAAGGRLALGTDSLASCPDLDVLAEIPVLAGAFPDVPVHTWLAAATHAGADAVAPRSRWARVAPGRRPGLLQLDVGSLDDLARGAPSRRWLVHPGR